jgi:hypothetical protein
MATYQRTEDGVVTVVSVKEGLAEINNAMMAGKREVRTMSSITRTDYAIEYKDGRKVTLVRCVDPEPAEAARIITVKGKRYVVGPIKPEQTERKKIGNHSYSLPHPAYASYWSERNGVAFGPTRGCSGRNKPGTVGRAIWDAVNAA